MRISMRRLACVCVIALALPAAAHAGKKADHGHWLHISVDGESTVHLSVPLATVASFQSSIPGLSFDGGDSHGGRFDVNRLRAIWLSLRDHEGDLLTIDSDDGHVRIRKTGSQLLVLADGDDDEKVEIKLPVKMMDALFPDESTVDIAGALAVLAEEGSGELVRITSASESVRIWVDSKQ